MEHDRSRKPWQALCGVLLLWALPSLPSQAIVLDWATLTSNGATTPSLPADAAGGLVSTTYTNVGGSGIDVTIGFQAFTPNGSSIAVDTVADYIDRTTPIAGDTEGGAIRVNYDANTDEGYVTVTVSFSLPVSNFVMEVWDVDRSSWRDELRNIAGVNYFGGASFNPSSITPLGTNTVTINTTANSATVAENPNPDNPATTDGGADVVINFGTTATSSISFDYGNNPTGVSNPASQLIWISGFSFDAAVPEPSTYATGILLVLMIGVAEWSRRRKSRDLPA